MALTVRRVLSILTAADVPRARAGRAGAFAEAGEGDIAVYWLDGDRQVAAQPGRVPHLMLMRSVLLPHMFVTVYGTHYQDGFPVCLVVTEREMTRTVEQVEQETAHPVAT